MNARIPLEIDPNGKSAKGEAKLLGGGTIICEVKKELK